MPTTINSNYSLYTDTTKKTSDKDKKENEKSIIEKVQDATGIKTDRGTRIIKKGQDLDKNAFFKILAAELANQDPTNAKDGTEYVSQLAQFSSLEQMANLNSMMKLTGASSFIGKVVLLRKFDSQGNQYAGIVRNVIKSGDEIKLSIEYEPGKIGEFPMEDVLNITDDINENSKYNNDLLNAVSLIGKHVLMDDGVEKLIGVVKGVVRNGLGVSVRVTITKDGKEEDIYVPFEYVTNVQENGDFGDIEKPVDPSNPSDGDENENEAEEKNKGVKEYVI
ncbi:flagellar hook assembly protein FlgD [Clostridium tepidum]|jgi:flagellar basal-body rod modification protein FlgD|uniref:Basal-body rod modification protein FlgD n=1 Tax=Clostridium tepidum TaxID=1962263 RepID=A0A1S9IHG4_9CLOT|nr:flagellar hook capping FlgD N-terminal domain-containing protein [Clostridium tepidum]MCR1933652.1 flagellar biosynthesis protein FlgD [Clostridium tepidum]MDU6876835.1 flagellar hook capping FlgD N-terminal domain-containing protein [Clostridium botulinum]OOO63582.1 flagellar biosynthesis protein FlgD [Clostridium tepidum]OOO69730.1 flagellar biosynthesis protein FlgD [Clostridium tepidum]